MYYEPYLGHTMPRVYYCTNNGITALGDHVYLNTASDKGTLPV